MYKAYVNGSKVDILDFHYDWLHGTPYVKVRYAWGWICDIPQSCVDVY